MLFKLDIVLVGAEDLRVKAVDHVRFEPLLT